MRVKRAIVWFRNDLRLHDNEALNDALQSADEVLLAFVFDERIFKGKTSLGFAKTGQHRARFIIESATALRALLRQKYGGELFIAVGKPEEIIFKLANRIKSSWVFCNRERTKEEVAVQDKLEMKLWSIGQELRYCRGKMLLYTGDLPFPVTHTPDNFYSFKKEIEHIVPIREPLATPDYISFVKNLPEMGELPTLEDFGWEDTDDKNVRHRGGEEVGLKMLDRFLKSRAINNYKIHRLRIWEDCASSCISPYLSQGCLSPKLVYHKLKEHQNVKNTKSIKFIVQHLLIRDHMRFMAKKYGAKIFQISGLNGGTSVSSDRNEQIYSRWIEGRTDEPFINAIMNCLNSTGHLYSILRQIAGSYLIHELKQDWLIGAEYFESLLLDYDPASNYGNWNKLAGVSAFNKEEITFNLSNQARHLDPEGAFQKRWLP
jgi:deoxyribodipyrimidine photo-lyase